jgi:hypothetical protein
MVRRVHRHNTTVARDLGTGGPQLKRELFPTTRVVGSLSRTGLEAEMRVVKTLALFVSCSTLSFACAGAASAQTTYSWSDIDCKQSRITSWPGLKCKATNVVTTEGNVGAFRRWSAFGTTSEGYIHIFLWEAQNSFSYITLDETTAEFLKWMYENGQFAGQFSPLARYHEADYSTFRDAKQAQSCAGFRRTGKQRRGGYEWVVGGILCAPAGRNLTDDQFAQFIDRVRLQ